MKQLLILSGKGGTGKTTVAGAFIALMQAQAYADCDVDAPNLHLTTHRTDTPLREDHYGLPKAQIVSDKCTGCGKCAQYCRFGAVVIRDGFHIDLFSCEGCGVCKAVCPSDTIVMREEKAGTLDLYKSGSVFSTAQLKIGSGTSGMLVSKVKKRMRDACGPQVPIAVIDGSPGIGCPVIASLSGVDLVLIVTEPSVSGISDMRRIVETAKNFRTKTAVCINKYDTNLEKAKKIKDFCREQGLAFVGRIPYDPKAVQAVNDGRTIAEIKSSAGIAVRAVFENTLKLI
jgi:MinD superfamily P-loop ATPase